MNLTAEFLTTSKLGFGTNSTVKVPTKSRIPLKVEWKAEPTAIRLLYSGTNLQCGSMGQTPSL